MGPKLIAVKMLGTRGEAAVVLSEPGAWTAPHGRGSFFATSECPELV